MGNFFKLKIIDIHKVIGDTVNIDFELPENLKKEFVFYPGQFVIVKYFIEDIEHKRSYSLCTSPHKNEPFRITIKEVLNGITSPYANRVLKVGDELDVSTPRGKFYVNVNATNKKTYFMISAGSGIVPIYSMIKSILKIEPLSKVKLLYGNRNEENIIFGKELREMEKQYQDQLNIVHSLSKQQLPIQNLNSNNIWAGRIEEEHLNRFLPIKTLPKNYDIYICGPSEMNTNVKSLLEKLEIPKEKIHLEYFGKI